MKFFNESEFDLDEEELVHLYYHAVDDFLTFLKDNRIILAKHEYGELSAILVDREGLIEAFLDELEFEE